MVILSKCPVQLLHLHILEFIGFPPGQDFYHGSLGQHYSRIITKINPSNSIQSTCLFKC